jgi:hypothetical protein
VGNIKNGKPKKDLWLPFSLVRFFWASKRNEQCIFGRAKTEQLKSTNIKLIFYCELAEGK